MLFSRSVLKRNDVCPAVRRSPGRERPAWRAWCPSQRFLHHTFASRGKGWGHKELQQSARGLLFGSPVQLSLEARIQQRRYHLPHTIQQSGVVVTLADLSPFTCDALERDVLYFLHSLLHAVDWIVGCWGVSVMTALHAGFTNLLVVMFEDSNIGGWHHWRRLCVLCLAWVERHPATF